MNYMWDRADRIEVGMIVYRAREDCTITRIEEAGSLHLRFYYADGTADIFRRDAVVMFQCHHRRHYEQSDYH